MIVPDLNLLVYAYSASAPHHAAARNWWESALSSDRPVGLPWAVCIGFVRLMTHPKVVDPPMDAADAIGHVHAWQAQPQVSVLLPGPRHLQILAELLDAAGVAASLTTDAHLAALCIEHGAEMHSNDVDFARFPGLRWHNPLRA